MTLDHFGKPISYFLYQVFGFFSAAEGFFFLSGFVGILAAKSKSHKDPMQSWMRWRAFKTWRYHIATLIFLSIVVFAFLPKDRFLFSSLYNHFAAGSLWSALLINTPEWLDVLPLYVIFLFVGSLVFPILLKIKRKRILFLLWLPSLFIWLAAQFGLRDIICSIFPKWIQHGNFDPFGWQFIYFTGAFVSAWWSLALEEESNGSPFAVQFVKKLTPILFLILVFCFLWSHQFISFALPNEFFINKEHLGALRFANFFVFMLFICWIVRSWPNLLDFNFTNVLGRHSLDVYTAQIILIYFWMATPNSIHYHAPWNVLIPLVSCVILWALAKWREPKNKK